MWTFSRLWGISSPEEAKDIIESQSKDISDPKNLEEQAIKLVGKDIYEKLIKGYTEKQWRKPADQLPKEIIKRLPVRFTYDSNYFSEKYQGIPIGGYTKIFERLLEGIEVRLGMDYFSSDLPEREKTIYTGPIDRFYGYRFGNLEYKTLEFDHQKKEVSNFQGTAMMNFTDSETPHTRIVEHKHFEPDVQSECTHITYEYPVEYVSGKTDPYYPVNDFENNERYSKYKELADSEPDMIFGGRLAEYRYYDMHQVIKSALDRCKFL